MKSFYSELGAAQADGPPVGDRPAAVGTYTCSRARIAIYDAVAAAPRVEDVEAAPVDEYVDALSSRVYSLVREQGGEIPYSVIREVSENLIHAGFAEPVVSVLDSGRIVRFADQGPGIPDKTRAVQPGFTTATSEMKRFVRGVGSGLPLVNEYLAFSGGRLSIEDNLGRGTVVTIESSRDSGLPVSAVGPTDPSRAVVPGRSGSLLQQEFPEADQEIPAPQGHALTKRQKQVLALVMETGSAGPSIVSRELGVGISTAYRDLASLEALGLISSDAGKRELTPEGLAYLDHMVTGQSIT